MTLLAVPNPYTTTMMPLVRLPDNNRIKRHAAWMNNTWIKKNRLGKPISDTSMRISMSSLGTRAQSLRITTASWSPCRAPTDFPLPTNYLPLDALLRR